MTNHSTPDSRIKVTLIGTLPPIKGLSPYCLALAQSLQHKVKLEFLTFHRLYPGFMYPGGTHTKDTQDISEELQYCRVRSFLSYYNPISWIWSGLTIKGNIVHAQWWSYMLAVPFFVMLGIARLRRLQCVITVHNAMPHEKNRLTLFLNKIVLKLGHHIIVHNEDNLSVLSQFLNMPADRISVIPHGVLQPPKVVGTSQAEARSFLRIPEDAKVCLFFGNIRSYKGVDDLIEAMAMVVSKIPEAFLILAGQPWGNPTIYQKAIRDAGLEDNSLLMLEFVPIDLVETIFKAADVTVLPYKFFDAQSGVGAFSLFFGVPMIVTEVGGLPELACDPDLVLPPEDPPKLAQALLKVLSDAPWMAELSEKTKEKSKNYRWEDIATKTEEVYRSVMAQI